MSVKTKELSGGDFLIQVESPEFCLRSAYIAAQSGQSGDADLSALAGYPVIIADVNASEPLEAELALAGDESSVNGWIIHGPEISDLSPSANTGRANLYSILVEGPAVVNTTKLPTRDVQGLAFTQATLRSRLDTANIRRVTEPTKSTTQTT